MKPNLDLPLEQVFRETYLAQLGASFAEFQQSPQGTLEKYGQHDAIAIMRLGYRPLLPVQVRLRTTLLNQWRAEGTWDDAMAMHPTSLASAGGFFQRIRQVLGGMLEAVKHCVPEQGRPSATADNLQNARHLPTFATANDQLRQRNWPRPSAH